MNIVPVSSSVNGFHVPDCSSFCRYNWLVLTQSNNLARELPTGIGRIMRAVGRNIRRDRVAYILNRK